LAGAQLLDGALRVIFSPKSCVHVDAALAAELTGAVLRPVPTL
jgi:hypothetical protein